ncbi:MAG: glycoside hydrolase [Clostridia bacterium]|nr:glycoside hydrolase [Clostridia bacterium]
MKKTVSIILAACLALLHTPLALAEESDVIKVEVNAAKTSPFGAFEGWGTSLCWWAEAYGDLPEEERKVLSKAYFDLEEGLGLNFVRFNIGGGDDPTHTHLGTEGQAVPGWLNADGTYNKEADMNQLNFLLDAIEYGANIVECFSNSPPYTMTLSGCTAGGEDPNVNNIAPERFGEFAQYLARVVSILKNDYGVQVDTLEPMNEPNTNYWRAGGTQEGCHISPEDQSALILECAAALKAAGLDDVSVAASDETNTSNFLSYISKLTPQAVEALGRFNVHTYATENMEQLRDEIAKTGKKLFMSESDYNATAGVNAEYMGPALWFSQKITDDLRGLWANAWTIWQVAGVAFEGRESVGGYWHISQYNRETKELEKFKKYYAYGQFSKFIRQGDYLIDTDCPNILAAHNKESGKIALVVTNATAGDVDYSINLSSLGAVGNTAQAWRTSETQNIEMIAPVELNGKTLHVSVPQSTITTYVINPQQPQPLNGINISAGAGERSVFTGDTLQMTIQTEPENYAGEFIWSLCDENGNPTERASVDGNGLVLFSEDGNFIIKAALKTDASICDTYSVSAVGSGSIVNLICDCGGLAMAQRLNMDSTITQYSNTAYSAAKWKLEKKSGGWRIINLQSGKNLADENGLCVSGSEFLWTLGEKNGSFSLSKGDRYVDLYNWNTSEGAQIDMYSFTGSTNQYWSFRIAPQESAVEPIESLEPKLLTGELFYTAPWNSDVRGEMAFDKNFDTFFDTSDGSGGYIGLDLGEAPDPVTMVRYAPRFWYFSRMVGGVFQGAHEIDGEWTDLAVITHTPLNSVWSSLSFNNPQSFRFVRYKTPIEGYCNISEIEFYSAPYSITAEYDGALKVTIENRSQKLGAIAALCYGDGSVSLHELYAPECESVSATITPNEGHESAHIYVITHDAVAYRAYIKL